MDTKKTFRFAVAPLLLAGLVAPATLSGCGEDSPLGNLAEQCGLTCPDRGIIEGNASISGIVSVDAFFGAVVDFQGAAGTVNSNIRAQLDAIALSVGLQPGAASAEIKAALETKISAAVEGGLKVNIEPPRCEASVDVAVNAAAECDAKVDPGSVEVSCEGTCTIDASVQADCAAKGELKCKGTAPNLACSGTCTGTCSLDAAAECSGTCNGECMGTCSVKDSNGNCRGSCTGGQCKGTCELRAGGECKGKCEGSCEYTPPSAQCEANAEVRCTAKADANIKCKGGCEGSVTPPSVSAECKAAVEAKASANVECRPPSVDISFQLKAGLDAAAEAEFRGLVGGLKVRLGEMRASLEKATILVDAAANIGAAAEGAVKGAADVAAEGDLKASVGSACALLELPKVATALQTSTTGLQGSITASGDIFAAVGGM